MLHLNKIQIYSVFLVISGKTAILNMHAAGIICFIHAIVTRSMKVTTTARLMTATAAKLL